MRQTISKPTQWLTFIIALAFGLRLYHLEVLPAGLSLDEATNSLDALMLYRLPLLTPFLENNYGRETLFFYLQGALLHFAGISLFSTRFISTLLGTLTIPLMYIVAKTLTSETLWPKQTGLRLSYSPAVMVGLLAAGGLAFSYWHLYFSRLALRAILLLPILLLCVYTFWQGWHHRRASVARFWLIISGVLLGVSSYIYLAARLLPVIFTIFVVIDLAKTKTKRIQRLTNFLLFGITAAVVAIPLLLFFQQHAQSFSSRTQAISILDQPDAVQIFANNMLQVFRLIIWNPGWLGQWPALNIFLSVGLVSGGLFLLYRVGHPGAIFLWLWAGIGFAPVLISQQNWEAQTTILRGIIAWPAFMQIAGIGLVLIGQWLAKTVFNGSRPLKLPVFDLFLTIFLIGGVLSSGYNYFYHWSTNFQDLTNNTSILMQYVKENDNAIILMPAKDYTEQGANFLQQAIYHPLTNGNGKTLSSLLAKYPMGLYILNDQSAGESLFVLLTPPQNGKGAAYLLPALTLSQAAQLQAISAGQTPQANLENNLGETFAHVYSLTPQTPFLATTPKTLTPMRVNFAEQVALTGALIKPDIVAPGETVSLTLAWENLSRVPTVRHLFIHLFNAQNNQRIGQINMPLRGLLPISNWPTGLTVPDAHHFQIPPNAPDGLYRLEIGVYQPHTLQRFSILDEYGNPQDDRIIIGKVLVQSQPAPPPQHPINLEFANGIALAGLDFNTLPNDTQPALAYTLHWQALEAIESSFTVFTHLLDAQGNIIAQQDNMPVQGTYPTNLWSAAETVLDPYTLSVPATGSTASYTLRVGLYLPENGKRLVLKDYPEQSYIDLNLADFLDPTNTSHSNE